MTPREIFSQIYNILVEHAGASNTADTKEGFIEYFTATDYPGTEWRFQGDLGPGGKFRRRIEDYSVDYYREHETTERKAIVEKVCKLLKKFPYWHPRGY